MLRVYLIHPKRGLIQCHRISFDVIRCQLSQVGSRSPKATAPAAVPTADRLRSRGGLRGRGGPHAAEAGPVRTPHVAGPPGRRTIAVVTCGFSRFALDFPLGGRLALCRGGRWWAGGGYPPGYADAPGTVASLMPIEFLKAKRFINRKRARKRTHQAQVSPMANALRPPHAPPTYPHGVCGT